MTTIESTLTAPPVLHLIPQEEEVMLRDAVQRIASSFGPDYYQEICTPGSSRSHRELLVALAAAGYLGVHLPEEFGGGGQGIYELAAVLEECSAAGCPSFALVWSAGIVGTILAKHGSYSQKLRWLEKIATGQMIMSFAITEAESGSNSHNMKTVATPRAGGGYVLKGQKHYISGVEDAEAIMVVARTGTDANGRGLLSLFVVDADAPGLTRQVIPTAIDMPESQWTLFFDDVELDSEALVGAENNGLKAVFDGLNPERVLAAAICTGIARYSLAKAVDYAKGRQVWSTPIGAHQAIAHPLAEGKVALENARLMLQKAAVLYDAGADAGEASNMCKLAAADAAGLCLDRAIQTHGGNGVALEYQLSNYMFLIRFLRIAPVSREMVLNFVAQHTLKLPKSF